MSTKVQKVPIKIFPDSYHIHSREDDKNVIDFKKNGTIIQAAIRPEKSRNRISRNFVVTLQKKFDSIVEEYTNSAEDNIAELKLIGQYDDIKFHLYFDAWIDSGEVIGEPLQSGVDLELGSSTIWSIKMKKRRIAFLSKEMKCYPVFRARDYGIDENLCFVLMPFNEEWSDRIWGRHIEPTVESFGLKCKRADDFFSPSVIIEDIWKAINRANFLIADLTGRNPNVFYELGIAHVVGVPVILISQDHEIPAFDIAHWRQFLYQDNTDGCDLLERNLKKTIASILKKEEFL